MKNRLIFPTLLCTFFTSSVLALTPLDRINFVHTISDWKYIDSNRVSVTVGPARHYVLNLRDSCHQLRHSERIGITPTNNVVRPGFDNVKSRHEVCQIISIDQVSAEELDQLKAGG